MANLCSNIVELEGNEESLKKAKELIDSFIENNVGCKLMELNFKDTYCFDWYEIDVYRYQFSTKWSPSEEFWYEIAKKYNLKVTLDYEEPGCELFGRFVFENNKMKFACLNDEDFKKISYNEEDEIYSYNGFETESWSEVTELLFNELYSNYF